MRIFKSFENFENFCGLIEFFQFNRDFFFQFNFFLNFIFFYLFFLSFLYLEVLEFFSVLIACGCTISYVVGESICYYFLHELLVGRRLNRNIISEEPRRKPQDQVSSFLRCCLKKACRASKFFKISCTEKM